KPPATSRFTRHSPDKGGRRRSLLFFTLQPHRPKTRHQKWPSETESRNDAFVARSGSRRLSLIRRMGPICADFGGPPANNGGDRTFESSDSRDPAEFWPQKLFAFEVRRWGDAARAECQDLSGRSYENVGRSRVFRAYRIAR